MSYQVKLRGGPANGKLVTIKDNQILFSVITLDVERIAREMLFAKDDDPIPKKTYTYIPSLDDPYIWDVLYE